MPNGIGEGKGEGGVKEAIGKTMEKGTPWILNIFKRIGGRIRGRPLRERAVPGSKLQIVTQELKKYFETNDNTVQKLITIENDWSNLDKELSGKDGNDPPESLTGLYKNVGIYQNPSIIQGEAEWYEHGMGFDVPKPSVGKGGFEERKIELGSRRVRWEDGTEEEIICWGYNNIAHLQEELKQSIRKFDEIIRLKIGAAERDMINKLNTQLSTQLEEIKKIEGEHYKFIQGIVYTTSVIGGIRQRVVTAATHPDRWIRFKHTYKIIRGFVIDNEKIEHFKDWAEKNGWKKHNWETEPGLDESGRPLEIDDEGNVLLDKWWMEILSNSWQRDIIRKKPGGNKIIERYSQIKKIRKVPEKFIENLNALDTVNFINNEWDAYRDDQRDGRYHPHSKAVADYVIAADGIEIGKAGRKGKVIPTRDVFFEFDPTKPDGEFGYIKATPELFKNVVNKMDPDEAKVTRQYRMLLIDEEGKPSKQYPEDKEGERVPTHLSPAFDRAAIGAMGRFIHWGRMYYYEPPNHINKWSENPYPMISTRGIAKYLIDRVIRSSVLFKDQREALKRGIGYDYNITDFRTYKTNFNKDPLNPAQTIRSAK